MTAIKTIQGWLRKERDGLKRENVSSDSMPNAGPWGTALGKILSGIRRAVSVAMILSAMVLLGLIAVAFVLLPGGLGILTIESERIGRWLGKARDYVVGTSPHPNQGLA